MNSQRGCQNLTRRCLIWRRSRGTGEIRIEVCVCPLLPPPLLCPQWLTHSCSLGIAFTADRCGSHYTLGLFFPTCPLSSIPLFLVLFPLIQYLLVWFFSYLAFAHLCPFPSHKISVAPLNSLPGLHPILLHLSLSFHSSSCAIQHMHDARVMPSTMLYFSNPGNFRCVGMREGIKLQKLYLLQLELREDSFIKGKK